MILGKNKRVKHLVMIPFVCSLLFYNIAAQAQAGTIDFSFRTDFDFTIGESVSFINTGPDKDIVLSGFFTAPGYQTAPTANIIKLNKDGASLFDWNTGTGALGSVMDAIQLSDDRLIVCGNLIYFNSQLCKKVIRLNPDGSLDKNFTAQDIQGFYNAMAQQKNGSLVLGEIGNSNRFFVTRLLKNGLLDSSFYRYELGSQIYDVLVDDQDRIYVSGFFNNPQMPEKPVIRLLPNGQKDLSFSFTINLGVGGIFTMAKTKDRKIMVSGTDNTGRKVIFKLRENGTVDSSFNFYDSQIFGGIINTMYPEASGKIIVGGNFKTILGKTVNNIARINPNGSLDTSFISGIGFDGEVLYLAEQNRDKLLVSGKFSSYNGDLASRIVRLHLDELETFDLKIYPNPVMNIMTIEANLNIEAIKIYTIEGKEIMNQDVNQWHTELDISQFANGLYFIRAQHANGVFSKKFLKVDL